MTSEVLFALNARILTQFTTNSAACTSLMMNWKNVRSRAHAVDPEASCARLVNPRTIAEASAAPSRRHELLQAGLLTQASLADTPGASWRRLCSHSRLLRLDIVALSCDEHS